MANEKKSQPNKSPMKIMNEFFQERPRRSAFSAIDDYFLLAAPENSFPVDVFETEKHFVIQAELPGVPREDIIIDRLSNELRIKVKRELKNNRTNNNPFSRPQRPPKNEKSISLPEYVLPHKLTATHRNGILEVLIPKKKRKKIDID
ncbi:Hsp20/alpha crystallin family protein [Bacillus sp. SM2101]|uniref:Hsp20/alpha crystallin family protein n=1 Tax=Bacillus sp. SM2101 TaxID=2805366 RepID=UPI001BDF34FF|nr:Hsp20/alpha crystallin family protein [Bacillus sp. SM2101]